VKHVHESVSLFDVTVWLHGAPAVPLAWAVLETGPPVVQAAASSRWPRPRLPACRCSRCRRPCCSRPRP
jgi:hypothetical protein